MVLFVQIISTIAGQDNQDLLDVKLTMFNNATEDENYVDMDAVDMSVSVCFGRTRIVFLNKFVSSLLVSLIFYTYIFLLYVYIQQKKRGLGDMEIMFYNKHKKNICS